MVFEGEELHLYVYYFFQGLCVFLALHLIWSQEYYVEGLIRICIRVKCICKNGSKSPLSPYDPPGLAIMPTSMCLLIWYKAYRPRGICKPHCDYVPEFCPIFEMEIALLQTPLSKWEVKVWRSFEYRYPLLLNRTHKMDDALK